MGWKEGLKDMVLTQIAMLTSWDMAKIGVNGVHEPITPRTLRCPARSRGQRWADKIK